MATSAKDVVGGSSAATSAVLDAIEAAVIDSGRFKYILIEVTDKDDPS